MKTRFIFAAALCFAACDKSNESKNAAPAPTPSTAGSTATGGTAGEPSAEEEEAEKGPSVAAYDFIHNRHLAHHSDNGLVIDIGHPSAVKYVDGSKWYEGFDAEDALVSNPRGDEATFTFPLGGPHREGTTKGAKLALRFRPLGSQTVRVYLRPDGGEETELDPIKEVESDYQTKFVALPDGLDFGKEYTVRFKFSGTRGIPNGGKSAAEIDWLHVGIGKEKVEVERRDTVFDTLGSRIRLGEGDAVWWHFIAPENAEFVAGGDGLLDLVVQPSGGKAKTFETGTVGKFAVDLSEYAGKPIRLAVVARSDASLTRPRLDVPQGEEKDISETPKYIVVWSVEGLRADMTSVQGGPFETPAIEEFAKNAIVYERAVAQSGDNELSLATMFTMAYPPKIGATSASPKVPYEATLLPEPFGSVNWVTGFFTHAEGLADTVGIERGFDEFVVPSRKYKPKSVDTEALLPRFEEWFRERKPPVFAFVHTVDVAPPFDPPPTLVTPFHEGAAPDVDADAVFAGKSQPDEAGAAYLRALYKAEVTHADNWFGAMLGTLDSMGIRDKTMIVLTANRGTLLGEYGKWGDGGTWTEATHVPLMIQFTPWTAGGARVADSVELIDLYRTMIDAGKAGRVTAINYQGDNIVRLAMNTTARVPRAAFSYADDEIAVRIADWTYRRNEDGESLFLLASGEGAAEASNAAAEHGVAMRMMRDAAGFQLRYHDTWDKTGWGVVNLHADDAARKLDKRAW